MTQEEQNEKRKQRFYEMEQKLVAITVVTTGYGGDMPEELCNGFLDDIDYHFNKVKCRKIEMMMPRQMKMVEGMKQKTNNV